MFAQSSAKIEEREGWSVAALQLVVPALDKLGAAQLPASMPIDANYIDFFLLSCFSLQHHLTSMTQIYAVCLFGYGLL